MKNYLLIVSVVAVICITGCGTRQASNPAAETAAMKAAESWLALVDKGEYGKSWSEAAGYFKGAVQEEKWEGMIRPIRKPLGKVLSRKVKGKQYMTSMPGAPDGEYVIIQFDTSFEKKAAAIETVTPVLDDDGKWRVSGYFIK